MREFTKSSHQGRGQGKGLPVPLCLTAWGAVSAQLGGSEEKKVWQEVKENRKTESDFDELFRDAKEFQEAVKKEINSMKSGFDTG